MSSRPIPIGRFAPSPTGNLHLGSLVTAIASFCIAKQQGGQWLVRIEDIDSDRCRPEYTKQILQDLARFSLHSDGEIRYQSQHLSTYHDALAQLKDVSYGCNCTRKFIEQYNQKHALPTYYYPQLCYRRQLSYDYAVRVIMPNQQMVFFDQLQGIIQGNPHMVHGDIVVRRRPINQDLGMINYMLAVVIDDAKQGVNQVVRGLDILPLTIPQLVLNTYLNLPSISQYYHLPILVNHNGQKLSKQTLAEPITGFKTQALLQLALRLLQQRPVDNDTPERMLTQAVQQWDSTPLQGQQQIYCSTLTDMLDKP